MKNLIGLLALSLSKGLITKAELDEVLVELDDKASSLTWPEMMEYIFKNYTPKE